jgi:hypothetical protein
VVFLITSLTGGDPSGRSTVWSAATLTGHDPKTVKRYVEARNGGRNPYEREPRPKMIDAFLEKVEEWVEQSKATIRADVVHAKLVKMGYRGSALSTRRAVNAAKVAWKAGKRRTYRPWIPEPVAAVRLGRGAADRGPPDLAVLRVAVLVAVSGGDPGLGLHPGHAGGLPGHHAQADRRDADACADGHSIWVAPLWCSSRPAGGVRIGGDRRPLVTTA